MAIRRPGCSGQRAEAIAMQMRSSAYGLFVCLAVLALAGLPTAAAAEDFTCVRQSGDLTITECSRAIDSHLYAGRALARLHADRGVAYQAQGDLDHAMADFTESLRADPTYARAYYNRGVIWYRKRDPDRAIADYSEAIRLDPKSDKTAYAYINRGTIWVEKGELDRAIADFDQAIRLDPKDTQAYYNRGIAREKKRSLREALADFKMHSQLVPSDPDGLMAVERILKELSAR
jgi:tetratricopeptide (TPR) repeat protein